MVLSISVVDTVVLTDVILCVVEATEPVLRGFVVCESRKSGIHLSPVQGANAPNVYYVGRFVAPALLGVF